MIIENRYRFINTFYCFQRREGANYDLKSELREFVKAQKIQDIERANN